MPDQARQSADIYRCGVCTPFIIHVQNACETGMDMASRVAVTDDNLLTIGKLSNI